jgi:hypothetical protein
MYSKMGLFKVLGLVAFTATCSAPVASSSSDDETYCGGHHGAMGLPSSIRTPPPKAAPVSDTRRPVFDPVTKPSTLAHLSPNGAHILGILVNENTIVPFVPRTLCQNDGYHPVSVLSYVLLD